MRLPAALALVALGVPVGAAAQTAVSPGPLSTATTWTLAGSPYTLSGDVTITSTGTLRVEAGVRVEIAGSDAARTGIDTSRVELTVSGGSLTVAGTETQPVEIGTAVGSDWRGILVPGLGSVLDLEHTRIVGASTAIDTSSGGALRFVTVPLPASIQVRNGNLSFRDSDVGAVRFTSTGTASVFRTIFRGAVGFDGARAYVDHATFLGDVTGTGGADIYDSLIRRARNVTGALALDHVLIDPISRGGTTVRVDSDVPGFAREASLLTTGLRPTSNSPARNRGTGGSDLGALPHAGDPTGRWVGWLWDGAHMTRENQAPVDGDLTVPEGTTFLVDPGVTLAFPFGADELEYEMHVFGTFTMGAASGPPARITGNPTLGGAWDGVIASGPMASVSLTHVTIDEAGISASAGADLMLEDVTINTVGPAIDAAEGTTFAMNAIRASTAISLNGSGSLSNVLMRTVRSRGLQLFPGPLEVIVVSHATVVCDATTASRIGVGAGSISTGRVTLANSIVTGCGTGIQGVGTGVTLESSLVGGNAMDLVALSRPVSVLAGDPRLAPTGIPLAGSPAIDAADPARAAALDIDGVARPADGDGVGGAAPDMGAFETGRGTCGDGTVSPGERCDDGATPGYGWDACAADCRGHGPYCGDGTTTTPVEQCDGGSGCTPACRFGTCGDGYLLAGEDCDDGNAVTTDACVACMLARCGDGFVQSGVEVCDPGAMPACSMDCTMLGDGGGLDGGGLDAGGLDAGDLDAGNLDGGARDVAALDGGAPVDAAGRDAALAGDAGSAPVAGGCGCRVMRAPAGSSQRTLSLLAWGALVWCVSRPLRSRSKKRALGADHPSAGGPRAGSARTPGGSSC